MVGGDFKGKKPPCLSCIASYKSIASAPGSTFLSLVSPRRRVRVRKDGLWTTNLETIFRVAKHLSIVISKLPNKALINLIDTAHLLLTSIRVSKKLSKQWQKMRWNKASWPVDGLWKMGTDMGNYLRLNSCELIMTRIDGNESQDRRTSQSCGQLWS